MSVLFDKKVQLKTPITIDVNGLDFTGNAISADLIYLYPDNVTVQVNPGNVFLDKNNDHFGMPTLNQARFGTEEFSESERTTITAAVDIIKSKINKRIEKKSKEKTVTKE